MRILQIINSLGTGGAEKLLLDTIPLYRQAGIEMDLLVLWDNDHAFLQKLKELNCCKIYVLKQSDNYRDIYNPFHIFKIRKIVRQYDIAHVHLFPAQYYVAFASSLGRIKTKLVFTEHCTSNTRLKNKIFKPIEQVVYKKYTKIICITEEIRDIYVDYLKSSLRVYVIHNGVDIKRLNEAIPLSRYMIHQDIREDDFLLLQVSAFRLQKDQVTLIKALLHLPQNVKLILVGDGENLQLCESLAADLGLGQRVFFIGQRMDVPALLKTTDLIVLSSRYEGLSLSCIEGMSSGKPFIASDVPGLKEIVRGAGVLFPQGDDMVLADEIGKLMDDKELCKQVAGKCVDRAREYDINRMVEKHIELYRDIYNTHL